MTPKQIARKIREAFDSCDVARKNIALRLAFDTLATARLEAAKAMQERCARVADVDAATACELLEKAKKRYAMRDTLAALGSQGDPDAECIHLEACANTATDIAAAIRALDSDDKP